MSRWFRFYAEAMRNPKVIRLSDADFRLWMKLLSIASENDGIVPEIGDLKLVLNARLDHLLGALKRLISGGLIDPLEVGYKPHGWEKYQYKSDTSNERVAKHRAKGNVTVTPPDTEAETEKKESADALPAVVREDPFVLPVAIPAEAWAGFIEMRKRKRANPTDRAKKLLVAKLARLAEDGHPPGAVLDQSTANGWTDIYEIKGQANGRSNATAGLQSGNGPRPHSDRLAAGLRILADYA